MAARTPRDEVDERCSVCARATLTFNDDGSVDRRCSAVRGGQVILKDDGCISRASPAFRSRELRFVTTEFEDAFRPYNPLTGGWRDQSESAKRSISALIAGATAVWIGIASNGEDGCRARWNAKYRAEGMWHMQAVYETSSDDFRRNMESELIEFYGERCENLVAGGGGAVGTAPYVVYCAWK